MEDQNEFFDCVDMREQYVLKLHNVEKVCNAARDGFISQQDAINMLTENLDATCETVKKNECKKCRSLMAKMFGIGLKGSCLIAE
ncbi:MAG: hypothetical protein LBG88_03255 [Christensenellaceae bacterium]|jgi:hypothetical protein|nr:hypothetical protein [Christensenellaceae bacterium]